MKKNGFTLVELLAILVILSIIGLITVPIVVDSINNSKKKAYSEQVKRIIDAANNWAYEHSDMIPKNKLSEISNYASLSISELQSSGYLKDSNLKNPLKASELMSNDIRIYYIYGYNQPMAIYCDSDYSRNYYKDEGVYNSVSARCSQTTNMLGDVDDNRSVTQADWNYVNQYITNNEIHSNVVNIYYADINLDGIVDYEDLDVIGLLKG